MNCGHAFAATIRGSQRRDGWCVECRLSRSPVATSKTAHAIDGEKNAPWFRILLQFGAERRPDVPNVPTAIELATTEADRALLRFYAVKFNMARPLVAPPDVPAERVAALRAAFDAVMRDPLYLDEARRIGLEVNPLDGEGIAKLIRQVQATPQDVVERLRELLASARSR